MKLFEVRGNDISKEKVRVRDIDEELENLAFVLRGNGERFIEFETRDLLKGVCFKDFTGNLTVATEHSMEELKWR